MRCGQRKRGGKHQPPPLPAQKVNPQSGRGHGVPVELDPFFYGIGILHRHSPMITRWRMLGMGPDHMGEGLWERAWLTDTKECYERRRGTCFHFVSNVKSRARGSDDDREGSFLLKMCEFMVLPCRPHSMFKMAADIPVHLSPHGERKTDGERDGQILSFVLPSI